MGAMVGAMSAAAAEVLARIIARTASTMEVSLAAKRAVINHPLAGAARFN